MNYKKRKFYGMSLAELLVTIAIISGIIIAMATFFARGLIAVKKNQTLIPGYEMGRACLEKMRRADYDTITDTYFPSYDEEIRQNGIDYNFHINSEVIYKPALTMSGHTGRGLIKIQLKIDWEAIEEQGRKDILLETYIYTEPDY